MRADFPLVLDACVLAPAGVCDLYLRLAEEPRLYSPRWSQEILDEVHRTQIGDLNWPESLADYWRSEVTKAFPEALVTGYEAVVPQCTNHPKDRHVLAAAIKAPAYAIVTFNLRHFPKSALEPYAIVAHHPAQYLCTLYDMAPGVVTGKVFQMALDRGIEPQELLWRLRRSLPRFADYFALQQGWTLREPSPAPAPTPEPASEPSPEPAPDEP
jgi:hypothetical protein